MTPTKTTTTRLQSCAPCLDDGVVRVDLGENDDGYEACDDGNNVDTDACRDTCRAARCGDGVQRTDLQAGEEGYEGCDDGNEANDDACLNTCASARCGDGVRRTDLNAGAQGYERCDDGNEINDDGCADCQLGYGNGSGGDLVLNNARQINTARAAVRGRRHGSDHWDLPGGSAGHAASNPEQQWTVGQFERVRIKPCKAQRRPPTAADAQLSTRRRPGSLSSSPSTPPSISRTTVASMRRRDGTKGGFCGRRARALRFATAERSI